MKKKILIVGPAWVGDMVMAQALFKALQNNQESVEIDVLAPNWSRALLDRMPEVRNAHSMPIGHGLLQLKQRYQIGKSLRAYQYDQAIVLPNSWKSALIPWFAKIPLRTGFMRECRWVLLNDIRYLDKKSLPLMIQRFIALAHPKGKDLNIDLSKFYPQLTVDPALLQTAIEKFSLQEEIKRKVLVLCPGAEFGASKRWPESYYATIANAKLKEGWSVWIMGSQNDKPVAAQIQAETEEKCIDLTGKTNLGEAIDLMSKGNLVISNDSGLMHVAAALQKPLIAVYGSTDPGFTPPLGNTAKVVRLSLPCSPCFKRECPLQHHACMRELYPEKVLATIDSMVL